MATADQLKALIRSHAEADNGRFYSVALQVAAQEAHVGHGRLSRELVELVDRYRARTSGPPTATPVPPTPIAAPRGDLAGLLGATYPEVRLSEMVLAPDVLARLEEVLTEQRRAGDLRRHALEPVRKLLLVGPPGTGKTMTANMLAATLGWPLFTVRLDTLITRYLGETAAKLRLVFDAMSTSRGVYLFDEFDALGADRATPNDVGEIRRVLNSFLQFMEQDSSDSVIVAATNHASLLDRALFRRFDFAIEYPLPGAAEIIKLLQSRLATLDTSDVDWTKVAEAAVGLSQAELVRSANQVAKRAVLANRKSVRESEVLAALTCGRPLRP